jgi:hypothetical protein
MCMTMAGRYKEAADIPAQALEQARALNARRFEAAFLADCAEVAIGRGNRREALALVREGLAASEEMSPGFVGPILYGLLGLIETERSAREAALAAGEALLAKGAGGTTTSGFVATLSKRRCNQRHGRRPTPTPTRSLDGRRRSRSLTPT